MLQIHFIAEHEKWDGVRIFRHGFHKELLFPDAEVVKRLAIGYIEH